MIKDGRRVLKRLRGTNPVGEAYEQLIRLEVAVDNLAVVEVVDDNLKATR